MGCRIQGRQRFAIRSLTILLCTASIMSCSQEAFIYIPMGIDDTYKPKKTSGQLWVEKALRSFGDRFRSK